MTLPFPGRVRDSVSIAQRTETKKGRERVPCTVMWHPMRLPTINCCIPAQEKDAQIISFLNFEKKKKKKKKEIEKYNTAPSFVDGFEIHFYSITGGIVVAVVVILDGNLLFRIIVYVRRKFCVCVCLCVNICHWFWITLQRNKWRNLIKHNITFYCTDGEKINDLKKYKGFFLI